jgi:hypothetical protein
MITKEKNHAINQFRLLIKIKQLTLQLYVLILQKLKCEPSNVKLMIQNMYEYIKSMISWKIR